MSAAWDILTAVLLLTSGVATLCGAIGVWTLPTFFDRMHPPALAYSAGAWTAGLAATVHFARFDGALGLKAMLVAVLFAVSVSITNVILARSGLFRERWQARQRDVLHPSELAARSDGAGARD